MQARRGQRQPEENNPLSAHKGPYKTISRRTRDARALRLKNSLKIHLGVSILPDTLWQHHRPEHPRRRRFQIAG